MCAYKGLRNVSFLEYFAYALQEWSLSKYSLILEHPEEFFTFTKEIIHVLFIYYSFIIENFFYALLTW